MRRTLCVLALALAAGCSSAASSTPAPHCQAEDMVPVQVLERSYDLPAGATGCVHVDHLEPAR